MEFIGKLPRGSVGLKVEAGVPLCRGFAVWGINSRINIYKYLPSMAGGKH